MNDVFVQGSFHSGTSWNAIQDRWTPSVTLLLGKAQAQWIRKSYVAFSEILACLVFGNFNAYGYFFIIIDNKKTTIFVDSWFFSAFREL